MGDWLLPKNLHICLAGLTLKKEVTVSLMFEIKWNSMTIFGDIHLGYQIIN